MSKQVLSIEDDPLKSASLEEILSGEERDPITDPGKWATLEERYGADFASDILYILTRKRFEPEAAQRYWRAIIQHRGDMLQNLGRDMGLRACLCDYFVNIQPTVKAPLILEEELFAQKEQTALCDELTGLFNRRFFNNVLDKQIAVSQRYEQVFSLVLLDVDWFKHYNDGLGHLAGDQALMKLASVLQGCARNIDYVVRFGGEEFAVILPQADKNQAMIVAERYRRAVENKPFAGQEIMPQGRLTISLGVATYPDDGTSALELIDRADKALYWAKGLGRNQVQGASKERRRHQRVPFRGKIRLRHPSGQREYGLAQALDISQGGLGLRSQIPVDSQGPLEFVIEAPEHQVEVSVRGSVVRICLLPGQKPVYELGVALLDPPQPGAYQALLQSSQEMTIQ